MSVDLKEYSHLFDLVPPTVPENARELVRSEGSVTTKGWFLLGEEKSEGHIIIVDTKEPRWMPFGIKISEEINQELGQQDPKKVVQEVFEHPFSTAAMLGAGAIQAAASHEADSAGDK